MLRAICGNKLAQNYLIIQHLYFHQGMVIVVSEIDVVTEVSEAATDDGCRCSCCSMQLLLPAHREDMVQH
jgi:hypothetical protein